MYTEQRKATGTTFHTYSNGKHFEIELKGLLQSAILNDKALLSGSGSMFGSVNVEEFNRRLTSSRVSVYVKRYEDSLVKTECPARLYAHEGKVRLRFSVSDGSNTCRYNFPIMNLSCKKHWFSLWGANVENDEISTRHAVLSQSISNGMSNCSVERNFSYLKGMMLTILSVIGVIVGTAQAFAYFSM